MIKYYSEEFPLLRGSEFSIGLDLYATEDVELEYGRPVVVGTGVRLFLPWNEYREAQVRIRSSLGKNGIIIPNAPATIDVDYSGEIKVILCHLSTEDPMYHIWKGNRIAQLVPIPQPFNRTAYGVQPTDTGFELPERLNWEEYWTLYESVYGNSGRGDAGFGSTGR